MEIAQKIVNALYTSLYPFGTDYRHDIDGETVVYSANGKTCRVSFCNRTGEYRLADTVTNGNAFIHYNPENIAGKLVKRLR